MKKAILGHLTSPNPARTPATTEFFRYAARLLFSPAPGWWLVARSLRRFTPGTGGTLGCDRETHERNLASGAEMMWTFDGVNYWRLEGRLYARRNRSDVERGISVPWTAEERRIVERQFLAMRAIIALELACIVVAVWLAFRGG